MNADPRDQSMAISRSPPERIHIVSAVIAREPRALESARHVRSHFAHSRCRSYTTLPSRRCNARRIAAGMTTRPWPEISVAGTLVIATTRCSGSSARLWGERAPRGVAGRVRLPP